MSVRRPTFGAPEEGKTLKILNEYACLLHRVQINSWLLLVRPCFVLVSLYIVTTFRVCLVSQICSLVIAY